MVGAMIYSYIFYISFVIFVVGFIFRVIGWANIPVPLNMVTTGRGYLDNPQSRTAAALRLAADVFLFRSLWNNTKYDLTTHTIKSNRTLWLGAFVFHVSFLFIIIRHFRLFTDPVPSIIVALQGIDSITPVISISGILVVVALSYLFIRRLVFPELQYISILPDYFVLLLLLAIVITGNFMRAITRIDVVTAKQFMIGIFTLSPVSGEVPTMLGLHLLLVSLLLAYFPFSKLMHAPGVFFSPTRNQVNNPRTERHINPWDYPVEVEPWTEYREKYDSQEVLRDVEA